MQLLIKLTMRKFIILFLKKRKTNFVTFVMKLIISIILKKIRSTKEKK